VHVVDIAILRWKVEPITTTVRHLTITDTEHTCKIVESTGDVRSKADVASVLLPVCGECDLQPCFNPVCGGAKRSASASCRPYGMEGSGRDSKEVCIAGSQHGPPRHAEPVINHNDYMRGSSERALKRYMALGFPLRYMPSGTTVITQKITMWKGEDHGQLS
jgi:hypothetical protein